MTNVEKSALAVLVAFALIPTSMHASRQIKDTKAKPMRVIACVNDEYSVYDQAICNYALGRNIHLFTTEDKTAKITLPNTLIASTDVETIPLEKIADIINSYPEENEMQSRILVLHDNGSFEDYAVKGRYNNYNKSYLDYCLEDDNSLDVDALSVIEYEKPVDAESVSQLVLKQKN